MPDTTPDPSLTIAALVDALARAGDAVFVWTRADDRIEWMDRRALDRTLASLGTARTGAALAARYGPDHRQRRVGWLERPRPTGGFVAVHRIEGAGTDQWVEERLVRVSGQGAEAVCLGFMRNVTDLQAYQERLTYLACFDELTGHFTRARLRTVLAQSLVSAFAEERGFCFALIGLDNMAGVNHAFGYDIADEVLTGVGERIDGWLEEGEAIGRMASSKFGVILNAASPEAGTRRLRAMQDGIRDTFIETGSGPVAVTVSIGLIALPAQARTTQDALAAAEDALTMAKRAAPGGFAQHEPDEAEAETRRANIAMAEELSTALRENRICIAFQPIVASGDTKRIVFHECLARLIGRDGRLVPAARFMPVAEQLGFVRLIDQRVLELAFDVLTADPAVRLSVNLSPLTMNDAGWWRSFERLTDAHPGAARRLIIEITESRAIHDAQGAARSLAGFKKRGCAVALDDFGAGYTSFRYLQTLDLDMVKIDGSYVRGLLDSAENQLFVRSLTDLARHYGMTVVAEMVENDAAAALLRRMGVDCIQGNHFGAARVADVKAQAS